MQDILTALFELIFTEFCEIFIQYLYNICMNCLTRFELSSFPDVTDAGLRSLILSTKLLFIGK